MRTASHTTDTPQFELKRLAKDSIEPSLEKAEHYRLLNQPRLAESICLDILDVEPGNQKASVILLLALTDNSNNRQPGLPNKHWNSPTVLRMSIQKFTTQALFMNGREQQLLALIHLEVISMLTNGIVKQWTITKKQMKSIKGKTTTLS
jgi:hypothetical protein